MRNFGPALPEVRQVIDVAEGDAGLIQAISNCEGRKPSEMFLPIEPLLLSEGDDLAVLQERRSGVVVTTYAQDVHVCCFLIGNLSRSGVRTHAYRARGRKPCRRFWRSLVKPRWMYLRPCSRLQRTISSINTWYRQLGRASS